MKKYKTAVILAGGYGSRMGKLTLYKPKTLVNIMGKPILWYILNELLRNNFDKIIITTGYKGQKIKKYVKSNFISNLDKIEMIDTGENSSISKRIFKIKNYIDSNYFFLLNGDSIFKINYKKSENYFYKQKLDALFFSYQMIANYGAFEFNKKNKIIKFGKNFFYNKLITAKNNYFLPYVGMAILNKLHLNKINFKNYKEFEISFFNKILEKNKVGVKQIDHFWVCFDNQKDINNASKKNSIINNEIKKLKKIFNKLKK